jgi:hypothetical protein
MRCAVVHQGSLTLMDFSPGRLAMLRAQNSPENTDLRVVETPTWINAGRCFLRDFTSELPYCERTKEEIKNRVLMDDEWILQIEVRFCLWHCSCHDSLGCSSSQEEGLFGWEGYIDFHSILPTDSPCEA